MSTITPEGFTQIRNFIQTNWKYIQVLDDTNNVLFTVDSTDPRVGTQANAYTINPLVIELFLQGTDSEINLGTTKIGGANLLDNLTGVPMVTVNYATPFLFQNSEDQLTIKIQLQIPTI